MHRLGVTDAELKKCGIEGPPWQDGSAGKQVIGLFLPPLRPPRIYLTAQSELALAGLLAAGLLR